MPDDRHMRRPSNARFSASLDELRAEAAPDSTLSAGEPQRCEPEQLPPNPPNNVASNEVKNVFDRSRRLSTQQALMSSLILAFALLSVQAANAYLSSVLGIAIIAMIGCLMQLFSSQYALLDAQALSERVRQLPPVVIEVETSAPPFFQVVSVLRELHGLGLTRGALGAPRVALALKDTNGRESDRLEPTARAAELDPLKYVQQTMRKLDSRSSACIDVMGNASRHSNPSRRQSISATGAKELAGDMEVREFITTNFLAQTNPSTTFQTIHALAGFKLRARAMKHPSPTKKKMDSIAALFDGPFAESTQGLLRTTASWDFDAYALAEPTQDHALLYTANYLLTKEGVCETFNIPERTLLNFLKQVESSYHAVPYHNRNHVADVVQASVYLLHCGIREELSALDVLALIVAATAHDMGHPGQNNGYLIATGSPLAILYNDKSVLENHHCAQLFALLQQPSCDIFASLDSSQACARTSLAAAAHAAAHAAAPFSAAREKSARRCHVRKMIISMILGTDMAGHFAKVEHLKALLENDGADLSNPDTRLFILEVVLHAADISNPCRNEQISAAWNDRVTEEFYQQGDLEKENNIPVSKFFDREQPNPNKCQMGFMTFIVQPLYSALGELLSIEEPLDNLEQGMQRVAQRVAADSASPETIRTAAAAMPHS